MSLLFFSRHTFFFLLLSLAFFVYFSFLCDISPRFLLCRCQHIFQNGNVISRFLLVLFSVFLLHFFFHHLFSNAPALRSRPSPIAEIFQITFANNSTPEEMAFGSSRK